MAKTSSPAVTFMIEYTEPQSQFVDYTNRKDKVELDNELSLENSVRQFEDMSDEMLASIEKIVPEQKLDFKKYIDYMNRSYATQMQESNTITPLFNEKYNQAPEKDVSLIKEKLDIAYGNGSLLWKGVLSFDNEFLAKQGIFDKETKKVDQRFLKESVREAMPYVLKQEGLSDSAFWWGDIHLNTDNVHIHIGISEIESARDKIYYAARNRVEYKGHFSQKTLKSLKSNIFNSLINEQERGKILRQEQIIANVKTDLLSKVIGKNQKPIETEKFYLEQVFNHLPQSGKIRYGSNSKEFSVSKFFLDKYIDSYLANEGKAEYQEFKKESFNFLLNYKTAYTAEEKNREYEKVRFVEGKRKTSVEKTKGFDIDQLLKKREQDLRSRLGNKVLKYMKENPPTMFENNISNFSENNQKLIEDQNPYATLIKTAESWEREGRKLLDHAQVINVKVPVFEKDKNGEDTKNLKYFEDAAYYDIAHTELDPSQKGKISLSGLMNLSSDELVELINLVKAEDNEIEDRQQLGIYRYALKLKVLEDQKYLLREQNKVLMNINPIEADKAFVAFKINENKEIQRLADLSMSPNWKMKKQEHQVKKHLQEKYKDVVQLPIGKTTSKVLEKQVDRFKTEYDLVENLKDQSLIELIKGPGVTKEKYLEDLGARIGIVKTKYDINLNNKKIESSLDSEEKANLKRANGKNFSDLRKYYSILISRDEQLTAAEKMILEHDKPFQYLPDERSFTPRQTVGTTQKQMNNQNIGNVSSSFMKGLSSALQAGKDKNLQAIRKKARDDERDEREKKNRERN
ncbi:MobP2 family relaxase [Enterococcus avium]|uniref:MobP2 family relaxase n=1 Tax=Enterococcus avium TaxID=33945 RepID=UPI002891CFE6|nr:MobP2 family relaxase [Enterococcus avium]MDT2435322.1 MobP2 family relaxase [Enterococcus avium]